MRGVDVPPRCLICGTTGATCGTPTTSMPVDQRVRGRVIGDMVVPQLPAAPASMTDEEREEYELMAVAMARKSLRNQIEEGRVAAMAEGKAPHTSLSYVDRGDGILVKMRPDDAKRYVEMNDNAEIVREGALPVAPEGEVIGATKASTGEVFDENGRQKDDVQPFNTRTFNATDRVRDESTPPLSHAPADGGKPSIQKPAAADAKK